MQRLTSTRQLSLSHSGGVRELQGMQYVFVSCEEPFVFASELTCTFPPFKVLTAVLRLRLCPRYSTVQIARYKVSFWFFLSQTSSSSPETALVAKVRSPLCTGWLSNHAGQSDSAYAQVFPSYPPMKDGVSPSPSCL